MSMKNLVIYAHPNVEGHCSHILAEVKEQLGNCDIIDLYKLKYDPVLHKNELYTKGKKAIDKLNKSFQQKIKKADNLIFIYPVWWGTMPAILKGFFDKVLTSPFAFQFVVKPFVSIIAGYLPEGRLKGKKAAVFVTTGAKKWQGKLIGEKFKYIIRDDILGFCGIRAKIFQLANCKKWDAKRQPEIKRLVKQGLKFLK